MSEPKIGPRFQALDHLLREFPGTREADEALALAWDAPERGIRYLAAIRYGEAGFEFLFETASLGSETSRLRAMAMRHLARHAPREKTLPLIRSTLKARSNELLRTAVELAGRLQDKESIPALVTLGRHSSVDIRADIAHALGQIGDASAEPFLISLLEDPSIPVRLAAVQALGRAGTPAAISPLTKHGTRAFGMRDLAVAAKSAIARIEARFGTIEKGRLSLSEGPAGEGALSFQPEEGAVSITKDDAA
jgi:hypothetical protein